MAKLPSTYQREMTRDLHDPRLMDQMIRQQYGVSSQHMETALKVLMEVSQGRMPNASEMPFLEKAAKERYGFTPERTRAELRRAIAQPDPERRINAYLTANGQTQANPQEYHTAVALTQHALRADLEADLGNRLDAGQGNNGSKMRDNFEGMRAADRIVDDSRQKQDVRNLLSIQMGTAKPQTYQQKVADTYAARLRLADRIEHSAAKHEKEGTEPTLKETLSQTYDIKAVDSASQDVGLGSPIADADDHHEAAAGHLADDYDVTADL